MITKSNSAPFIQCQLSSRRDNMPANTETPTPLSSKAMNLLLLIAQNPNASLPEIYNKHGTSPAGCHRLKTILAEQGYIIVRSGVSNRRGKPPTYASITDSGKTLLETTFPTSPAQSSDPPSSISPRSNGDAPYFHPAELEENADKKCPHHWILPVANGPTSLGKCRLCGGEKEFSNHIIGDSNWEDTLLSPGAHKTRKRRE